MPTRTRDTTITRSDITRYTPAEWRRLRLRWMAYGAAGLLLVEGVVWLMGGLT